MARKTHYLDHDGIRVEGCANKTEARNAWEAKRDAFAKRAAECRVWTFCLHGHVVVVTPLPEGWEYTIVNAANAKGVCNASCYYRATTQVEAIAVALGALAQATWSRKVSDDAFWFDVMVAVARLRPEEMRHERDAFLHVVKHWRDTATGAA